MAADLFSESTVRATDVHRPNRPAGL